VVGQDGTVSPVWSLAQFDGNIKEMLQSEPYTAYWALLKQGIRWSDALDEAFGLGMLASATREFMGKKLANWGRQLGHVPSRLPPKKRDVQTLALEL
jgi:hypothetical protein